jgi:thioredoxin reductase (NADPH)
VAVSRVLSRSQLETLARHGEERTAAAGEKLYEIGDETYPFIAILEGEAAVTDGAGHEIVRHGASGFLGEMNLLSGQTVFLTAVVTEPMRYIAVDREALRELLFEDGALSDLLLSAFVERRELLQQRQGIGVEIVGPRESEETRRLLEFARRIRTPYFWLDPEEDRDAAALIEGLAPEQIPLVRLPGGVDLHRPSNGELSRALGIGLELGPREEVDLLIVGGGPAGLGAAVYGASEGLDTLVVEGTVLGGQAGSSRRIENYLGFPAGVSGTELTSRAVTQARKFRARTATPYRAEALEPGPERHLVRLEGGNEVAAHAVLLATGAKYRRLPVEGLEEYEGITVFYAAGPPEAHLCGGQRVGVVGGGNSAAQAAVWLARGGALVTLLHRRADLHETMSHYLIEELERYGVAVRDSSEIAALHGTDGELEAVTLTDGARLPLSFLFLFLGAAPCTDWLGDVVARDAKGFVLTGAEANADGLLETSVPGVYAAGDVRAGSIKRCATAIGEGATVVRFVHERLSPTGAAN